MENFEWSLGFAPRFGLYRVDYASYSRTPTAGATVLAQSGDDRYIGVDKMIRFGSRVDVYLPHGTDAKVLLGQKVIAGETILAEIGHQGLIEGISQ